MTPPWRQALLGRLPRLRPYQWIQPALATMLLALTAIGHIQQPVPVPALLLDVGMCLLAMVGGRGAIAACSAMVVLTTAYFLVSPDTPTGGELALPIQVLGLALAEKTRASLLFAAVFGVEVLANTVRMGRGPEEVVLAALFWVFMFGAAYLIGNSYALVRRAGEMRAHASLLADRASTARELHDTVAHSLTLLNMRAQRVQMRGRVEPEDLEFFAAASAQSVRELRAIMSLLRTDAGMWDADDQWQLPTLPDVVDEAGTRLRKHGIGVTITTDGDLTIVPGPLARVLDKVAREAVNNIIKHAPQGSAATILVGVEAGEVQLAFVNAISSRARLERPASGESLGLVGMRERLAAIDGSLVSRRSGSQWLTQVTVPLGLGAEETLEGMSA